MKQIFEWISMYYNRKILAEDKAIVETHYTKITSFPTPDEVLFQADLPIIEYRKKRAELQK